MGTATSLTVSLMIFDVCIMVGGSGSSSSVSSSVQVGQVFSTIGQPLGSLQIHLGVPFGEPSDSHKIKMAIKVSLEKILRNIFIAFID